MAKQYKIDAVIIDTGIIYAAADIQDSWNKKTVNFLNKFNGRLIIPSSVIPEVCYLLNTYLGQSAEIVFIQSLVNKEMIIEHLKFEDLQRTVTLLKTYDYLNLGFVDASVIAISERLKIGKILTTDRRHFSAVKPQHCETFTLLP
ncbi:MAG: PIN domain-containing protein [Thermodesulfovibrionales bacterium]|nr:PIN domain-containing protein [Thermodesulfovibrionales bacterium]